MEFSIEQLVVWVIIGGLAGATVGMVVRRNRRGFGIIGNILVGLVGAVIGGIIFDLLDIAILEGITFSADDLLAAIIGSLIFVVILALIRRSEKS